MTCPSCGQAIQPGAGRCLNPGCVDYERSLPPVDGYTVPVHEPSPTGPMRPLRTTAIVTIVAESVALAISQVTWEGSAPIWIVAGAVGLIGLMVWLYRAQSNLRNLPDARPRWSPGWAIGGSFIPIANLVIPALVLYDAGRNSGGRRSTGPLVLVWWLGYPGVTVTYFAAYYARYDSAVLDGVTLVLQGVGLVALATVLYRITAWHERRRRVARVRAEQLA